MNLILSDEELQIIYFFNSDKKERTRKAYLREIDTLKQFAEKPLFDIDDSDIKGYIEYLKRHKAPTTVRRVYDQLNSFLGYCFKEGHISSNPCYRVPKPMASKKVKAERTPTPDELKLLLHTLKDGFSPRDYAIALVILTCGLRIGEVLSIRWDNFAYTEEGCFLRLDNDKPSINYLYIYDFVLDAINNYREHYSIPVHFLDTEHYTFISNRQMKNYIESPDKCNHLTSDWFRKVMEEACSKADTALYTAKDLRHAFAVYAVNTGINKTTNKGLVLDNVARQMGLSSSTQMSKYNGLIEQLVVPSGSYAREFFKSLI